ncbi:MAG TPA: phospholipase D-like domain-containing protein, partial [Bacteroidia bacterium]
IAGSYYINYGKTPNLELGTISGTGTSATPGVSITGATPATIYYVQAFSINGTDTAKSAIKVFCTVSLSSGTIKAFFDRTVDTTVSTGTNAFQNTHIADTLAQYINRAKSTIDAAIYDWDNSQGGSTITNALNAAAARGVNIRIVYELSTPMTGLTGLSSSIKTLPSPQGSNYTIMHNKFVIIDANYGPNNSIVWTGSTNWTLTQLSTDANNVIIFQDQSLARGYKLEFDEMWGDTSVTSSPNLANSKFGQFKTDCTPHEYIIGGKRVESYFSPSDGTNTHILSTIGTANTDMYFGLMIVTRSDLATKIATQITGNSLTSKGILDDTTSASTAFFIMHNVMASNLLISKYSWIFHHKYLIIDQSNPSSDPLVLTGSHNWSNAGDQKNDENTVIVHDSTLANIYYQEFHQRWLDELSGAGIIEINNSYGTAYIYPNPVSNEFNVLVDKDQNEKANISVFNILGKEVVSFSNLENNNGLIKCSNLNLANGMYLIKISIGEKLFSSRIIINK